MRKLFTTEEASAGGITHEALKWGVKRGRFIRVLHGVYAVGPEPPTKLESALALVHATHGVASGTLAGVLHGLDAIELRPPYVSVERTKATKRYGVRRSNGDSTTIVGKYRCTNGLVTMLDLAPVLDDLPWEQALESALRKRIVSIDSIEGALVGRRRGNVRVRRVLKLRPRGAPPTESLPETLMVQLIRKKPRLPEPSRQVEITDRSGRFAGRVDLAFPDEGVFMELDGQQHKDQPVYDATRQTRVVAVTGWLVGRFTWNEVVHNPVATRRRLVDLCEQDRRRTSILE